jgi:Spy/CpxP family protein refolding chaperone
MFGFIVGTLSLIGLIKVARWGRHGRFGHGRGGGRWGGWMFRRLFERLDTTPGQEKVILEAADEARRVMWQAREEMFRAKSEYAKAMRGEQFDNEAVNAAFEKQQATLEDLKKTLKEKLQSIHEALNPQQRAALADLIEFGPRHLHGGHCGGAGRFSHGPFGHRGPVGGPSTVSV